MLDTNERRVAVIKGFTYGIHPKEIYKVFLKWCPIIVEEKITTLSWDGDRDKYSSLDDIGASFTALIKLLMKKFPYLEVITFKNEGKGKGLIYHRENASFDDYGNLYTGYTFLTSDNTKIHIFNELNTKNFPSKKTGSHHVVEFEKTDKWYQLGLNGLEFLKKNLGIDKVVYFIVGEGGAVKKENEEINKNKDLFPEINIIKYEIIRENSKLNIFDDIDRDLKNLKI